MRFYIVFCTLGNINDIRGKIFRIFYYKKRPSKAERHVYFRLPPGYSCINLVIT